MTTAVRPSMMSSLITSISFFLRVPLLRSASLNALVIARSKPRTWVPPFGVAMIFTNEERWHQSRCPTSSRYQLPYRVLLQLKPYGLYRQGPEQSLGNDQCRKCELLHRLVHQVVRIRRTRRFRPCGKKFELLLLCAVIVNNQG